MNYKKSTFHYSQSIFLKTGGIINSKLKTQNPKLKTGFSLIEMTVVMGIIAIIFLLGAGAFISARDQYIVDQATEEIITRVREAQNKSISVQRGSGGESVKVWGVSLHSGRAETIIIRDDRSSSIDSVYHFPAGITNNSVQIYFAAPFGSPYLISGICSWRDSQKATKELEPIVSSQCTILTQPFNLGLTYKGSVRATIVINPNGDIHVR